MAIRLLSVGAIVGVEALGNWYGGLGNTWMQMIAGVITMVAAVVLNWMLIGGHLGAPAMGVDGAALREHDRQLARLRVPRGRVLARAGATRPARRRANGCRSRELGRVVAVRAARTGSTGSSSSRRSSCSSTACSRASATTTVAALNVVIAVNSIAFMPAFGLASAGAILAGQAIGRGDRDAVWPQVKITLACTMTWMGAIGVDLRRVPRTRCCAVRESGTSGRARRDRHHDARDQRGLAAVRRDRA